MALLGTGTGPDQIPNTGRLGGAAFLNVSDLHLMFAPVLTLDQLRNEPVTLAKYIIVDDANVFGLFRYDSTDTSTNDDGKDVLKTIDERRYKRRTQLRRYTPTSSSDTNIALGEICYDDTRFYVRTASNVVKYITFSGTL